MLVGRKRKEAMRRRPEGGAQQRLQAVRVLLVQCSVVMHASQTDDIEHLELALTVGGDHENLGGILSLLAARRELQKGCRHGCLLYRNGTSNDDTCSCHRARQVILHYHSVLRKRDKPDDSRSLVLNELQPNDLAVVRPVSPHVQPWHLLAALKDVSLPPKDPDAIVRVRNCHMHPVGSELYRSDLAVDLRHALDKLEIRDADDED
mmetsp:Transcript_31048/g.69888  ORF Transcript_31048/g.69888 Transcript_31048/m.69888 type:complete len:206 (+) Transcript_31048:1103-1720(+)